MRTICTHASGASRRSRATACRPWAHRPIRTPVSRARQKEAIAFLNENAKAKLKKDPKGLKVAIIHEDGAYGIDVSKGNEEGAKKAGFEIVLKDGYAATAPDLSSLVTKLRRARPDVILHTGYNPDITLFLRQAKEQGLRWKALGETISEVSGIALLGDPGLGPEIAAARGATAAFHEVERAIGAGYADPRGGHCDASAAGAMGIHSPNPALIQSQALDPAQPEVLLYLPKEGGGVRLIGVEYLQPVLLRNPETGVVAPWLAQSPWPTS